MPSSAIKAGYASQVLPVDKMPEALQLGIRQFAVQKQIHNDPNEANGINRILLQLRTLTGHDFSQYKKSTIVRRIERRMLQNAIEDADMYARFLKEHPSEGSALFKELLINVTSFFRDTDAFNILQQDVLPELCKDKSEHSLFRAWVAGCATGEEAYSIAILLKELMEEHHYEFKVQIYATDLDDSVIATARTGIYLTNIAQDVTPERLRRFFTKEDTGYRIKKEIREMVVFAIQNVIKDPPFTKLDLLSCRNLMIYLGPELQNRLIPTFHYALNPGGVLFLSPSESIGNFTQLFSSVNRKWKFYRARHSNTTPRSVITSVLSWTAETNAKAPEEIMVKPKETNFADLTRRVMMQYYAPASVVTDPKGNILYVHGETGKYLRPAPGQSSFNVIEMAREGLELELRNAIRTAASEGSSTLNREIQVKTDSGVTSVSFSVRSLANFDSSQNLIMVSFQEIASPKALIPNTQGVVKPEELGRVEELERDLAYLKENYQATQEEQQASNEELKSTNEEMQSTNEELQSTNEELETSKEELQSVNEELITVNSELQAKIDQLAGMQNDMKNLLDNTHIGTVFLDEDLKIRRFTREASDIYRLVPTDVGRPLGDIKCNFQVERLLIEAKSVLETLISFEQEIQSHDGTWY
jgi:two-component system CheB/CheR fusion protein